MFPEKAKRSPVQLHNILLQDIKSSGTPTLKHVPFIRHTNLAGAQTMERNPNVDGRESSKLEPNAEQEAMRRLAILKVSVLGSIYMLIPSQCTFKHSL